MYYDEEFYNEMDYEEMDDVSVNKNTRKMAKAMEEAGDKKCHIIQQKNKRNITVFSSGAHGTSIRNAVSGAYTNDIVGSAAEDGYFRVSYPCGSERKKLFFQSPEQYERHFGYNLEKDTKQRLEQKKRWAKKASQVQVKSDPKPSVIKIH
jgi:replicative superfamily II helicase